MRDRDRELEESHRNERRFERPKRRRWQEPVLERRETLPRVTNGFASSFEP